MASLAMVIFLQIVPLVRRISILRGRFIGLYQQCLRIAILSLSWGKALRKFELSYSLTGLTFGDSAAGKLATTVAAIAGVYESGLITVLDDELGGEFSMIGDGFSAMR